MTLLSNLKLTALGLCLATVALTGCKKNSDDNKPKETASNTNNGTPGNDGKPGNVGENGKPGENGKDGKDGENGKDGKDAPPQAALDNIKEGKGKLVVKFASDIPVGHGLDSCARYIIEYTDTDGTVYPDISGFFTEDRGAETLQSMQIVLAGESKFANSNSKSRFKLDTDYRNAVCLVRKSIEKPTDKNYEDGINPYIAQVGDTVKIYARYGKTISNTAEAKVVKAQLVKLKDINLGVIPSGAKLKNAEWFKILGNYNTQFSPDENDFNNLTAFPLDVNNYDFELLDSEGKKVSSFAKNVSGSDTMWYFDAEKKQTRNGKDEEKVYTLKATHKKDKTVVTGKVKYKITDAVIKEFKFVQAESNIDNSLNVHYHPANDGKTGFKLAAVFTDGTIKTLSELNSKLSMSPPAFTYSQVTSSNSDVKVNNNEFSVPSSIKNNTLLVPVTLSTTVTYTTNKYISTVYPVTSNIAKYSFFVGNKIPNINLEAENDYSLTIPAGVDNVMKSVDINGVVGNILKCSKLKASVIDSYSSNYKDSDIIISLNNASNNKFSLIHINPSNTNFTVSNTLICAPNAKVGDNIEVIATHKDSRNLIKSSIEVKASAPVVRNTVAVSLAGAKEKVNKVVFTQPNEEKQFKAYFVMTDGTLSSQEFKGNMSYNTTAFTNPRFVWNAAEQKAKFSPLEGEFNSHNLEDQTDTLLFGFSGVENDLTMENSQIALFYSTK